MAARGLLSGQGPYHYKSLASARALVSCLLFLLSLAFPCPFESSALRSGLSDPALSLVLYGIFSMPSPFQLSCCGYRFSRAETVGPGPGAWNLTFPAIPVAPGPGIWRYFGCQAAWFGEGLGGQVEPGELPRMSKVLGLETNPASLAPCGRLPVPTAWSESGLTNVASCHAMGGAAHSCMSWQLYQGFFSLQL